MKSLENRKDADEIVARLRRLTPESQRAWGTLTPAEMLCHLADASECAVGRRTSQSVDNWFTRSVLRWIALRAPMQWPTGYATRPEFDPKLKGTRPAEFEADRARAIAVTEAIASLTAVPAEAVHPAFGRMSLGDWQRWAYLHADHHLRQFQL